MAINTVATRLVAATINLNFSIQVALEGGDIDFVF